VIQEGEKKSKNKGRMKTIFDTVVMSW